MMFAAIAMAVMQLAQGFMSFGMQRSAGKQAKQAGIYQEKLANEEATRLEQQAGQERAAAQRRAIEQRRAGNLVESRATALAAASGLDASSPSIVANMGDIETEAAYRASVAKYEGESAAQGFEYQAALQRTEGQNARMAGNIEKQLSRTRAISSLLGSGGQAGATTYAGVSGGSGGRSVSPKYESQIGDYNAGFHSGTLLEREMRSGSPLYGAYGGGGVSQSRYP